ncbi:MAG: DNA-directed RNA polymerase subunit K [Candidatus Pacearchaeota archaeon]
MKEKKEFTKYERARIIGARALQISMDAPILIKYDDEELNRLNYDPLRIAEKELDSGILPITVNQPIPIRQEGRIEKLKIEKESDSEKLKIKIQIEDEEEISKEGDILNLVNEDDDESELDNDFEDNELE